MAIEREMYHIQGITDWDAMKTYAARVAQDYGKAVKLHNHKNFEECNDKCESFSGTDEA